jgi:hypothetical protein
LCVCRFLEVVITPGFKSKFFGAGEQEQATIGRKELTATISRSAEDFTRLKLPLVVVSFGGRNDQYNNYSLNGAVFNNPFGLDAAGGQTGSQQFLLVHLIQITLPL